MDALKSKFRPEFINRVDEFITFDPLGVKELGSIVELEIKKVRERLQDREISLTLTDGAKSFLAEKGYDPVFG